MQRATALMALESRERSGCVVRGFGRRDALGGRRDAVGVLGVSLWSFWLVLSRVSPPSAPCAAVGRRVCGLACGVVPCFPHERGRAGALLRAPLWPSLGVAQCVAAAVGRSLLSDGMPRVSVPYSPTGLSGRALLTL